MVDKTSGECRAEHASLEHHASSADVAVLPLVSQAAAMHQMRCAQDFKANDNSLIRSTTALLQR